MTTQTRRYDTKNILKLLLGYLLLIVILLCTFSFGCAQNPSESKKDRVMTNHSVYQGGVAFSDTLWSKPEFVYDSALDRAETPNIKGLWIRSDYQDKESYAFAYLGIPEGASMSHQYPAVLLIHGGGGTAYYEWVKMWMDRGYVALALDMEGNVPLVGGTMNSMPRELYQSSIYHAPHNQNYADAALPIEETWMHYATRTAIIGNSFLHNLDGVNRFEVGVCGVSWGGIIASIISGYDDRFAFSVPIYCTLNQSGTDSTIGSILDAHPTAKVWDADAGLQLVSTPICFVVSNIDANARLDSISLTKSHCKNASLTIIKDWAHAQSIAAVAEEPYAFADSIIKAEKQITIQTQPNISGTGMKLNIPDGLGVERAMIVYTMDQLNRNMSWSKKSVKVVGSEVTYTIPEGTTAFYIAVENKQFLLTCSDLVCMA